MNAHDNLEEFTAPPNYDIEEDERSAQQIPFYCDLAKSIGGPVLEIACGSGLVMIPTASSNRTGYHRCQSCTSCWSMCVHKQKFKS